MQRRFLIIIGVALVVGFLASALVYRVVAQLQAGAGVDNAVPIVIATANIGLAETITAQHVKVVPWPKASVPPGAMQTVAQAEGRVARSGIVAGEPIVDAKLAPQLAGRGGIMPMLVREGERAVTIKVDDAIRETGFILPNSKVDILVSMGAPGNSQDKIAKVILQDVQVLAAGQIVEIRDNKPVQMSTVTMALTPDQTERLTLAQTEGRLFFVTRNMNDKTIVQTRGATKASLLAESAPPVVAAARPAPRPAPSAALPAPRLETVTVTVLHGTKASEHKFLRKGERDWVERGAEK